MVVLGGASTRSQAAGSPDLAWPARLAVALTSRFPAARVQVDNRAVARQTARRWLPAWTARRSPCSRRW